MKLFLITLLWCSPFLKGGIHDPCDAMQRIRINYIKAASDKKLCGAMIEELSAARPDAVQSAYLGGFMAIWARHTINPINKLNSFAKGKKYIEKAVADDPENAEIRFIRISVQKNCTSFLGYNRQCRKGQPVYSCEYG